MLETPRLTPLPSSLQHFYLISMLIGSPVCKLTRQINWKWIPIARKQNGAARSKKNSTIGRIPLDLAEILHVAGWLWRKTVVSVID